MSSLEHWVRLAREEAASDLHLEPGLPLALRVRGNLKTVGGPIPAETLQSAIRQLIREADWDQFLRQRSFDGSRTIEGARCRFNVLQSARGWGVAVRLLANSQPTLESLNLHPDFKRLVRGSNGLVLIAGPTGSGKSSTLAALIQQINLAESRHIITLEHPIEYLFRPRCAFIRQREVGRDTPSFEQGLLDVLREDPDVVMVGEMREPETMRLTLNAAETGHLVLATVHSSSCAEALQRVVGAFPSEIQANIAAQLADCLVGVAAQRLRQWPDPPIRVAECELLFSTHAAKAAIRSREFFKLASVLETGAEYGMWTWPRYQAWLQKKSQWQLLPPSALDAEADLAPDRPATPAAAPALQKAEPPAGAAAADAKAAQKKVIEIEPSEGGLNALLKKLEAEKKDSPERT